MTFKRFAKWFRIVGWLNIGMIVFNIMVIGGLLLLNIPPDDLLFIVAGFHALFSYVCFHMATRAQELSKLFKEDKE